MLRLRKASERGRSLSNWLDSRHSFSFSQYHDPAHMGFRELRVINEDRVIAGGGFGTHPHRDMEIVSYVLEGALAHRDSTGTGSVIRPGEIQRMSAGTGVTHSEMNASREEPVHFLQIWLFPVREGLAPGYEQKRMPEVTSSAQLDLIGSPDGRNGSVTIHQDVNLYRASLRDAARIDVPLPAGRHAWVQIARGAATVNGIDLAPGDGLAISDESALELCAKDGKAELLVFDLA